MKLFDSHCHLEDWMIERLDFSDDFLCCNIGCSIASSMESLEWTRKYPFVYGTAGLHPEFADEISDDSLKIIADLCREEKIVAIGEIGLDYHWEDNPPKEKQRECFERQIELAKQLGMPVCIHSRDADQETLDILKAHKAFDSIGVLMHCYSGSAELAKQYLKLGARISIAGPVTYKNNRKTVEVAEMLPPDRILIETDSPYLTPVPHRGEQNFPGFVIHTAEKIAEIKNMPAEELALAAYNNAKEFYGIK